MLVASAGRTRQDRVGPMPALRPALLSAHYLSGAAGSLPGRAFAAGSPGVQSIRALTAEDCGRGRGRGVLHPKRNPLNFRL